VDDLFDIESGAADGEDGPVTVVLRVHVQPGAGRAAVSGRHGDALKVRVAAPPEGGKANEACARFLAQLFGVAPSRVSLVSGPASRSKRFRVAGVELGELRHLLEQAVSEGNAGPGRGVRPSGHR